MSAEEAREIAVPFFRELGDHAALHGCVIGLEPNPPEYSCDFLTTTAEAAELAEAVNSPGCRLHFDTGCVILNGEDPLPLLHRYAAQLCHYHVSQPFLEDFSACVFPHRECAGALRKTGYTGLISIEMKRGPRGGSAAAGDPVV